MIYYITSTKYENLIAQVIQDADESVLNHESSDRFELHAFVLKNLNLISSVDLFLVDLTACKDSDETEEDLIKAIEAIRMVSNSIRMIVIDPTRYEGDKVLSKFFASGIYDIIVTDDNVQLKEELLSCIKTGREYKDATSFKDYIPYSEYEAKKNIKPDAEDVVIGISGTHARIGVTHNMILLANHLRKKGYLVALIDVSQKPSFTCIEDSYECEDKVHYFTLDGIDYFRSANIEDIKGKGYNFILIDFGEYLKRDYDLFSSCNYQFIVAGAKPWEAEQTYNIFQDTLEEELQEYHYYFNMVPDDMKDEVRQGMGILQNVHFLKVVMDPFNSSDFPEIEGVLNRYSIADSVKKKRKVK